MILWIGFFTLIFLLLYVDLGILNRRPHTISTGEAARWTIMWVSIALLFSVFVYFLYESNWSIKQGAGLNALSGSDAVLKYLTGYLVEESLSMDNIFVIAMILNYFSIPAKYQHRVLFWGIVGALFFRGLMIGIGVVLITKFSWMIYVFGLLLLYSTYKILKLGDTEIQPSKNPVLKLLKQFFPVITQIHSDRFFIRRQGIKAATPLFIALIVVETSDIMFAIDSIPAIFGITTDPFLVFSSNIFAILGLRSLYFVLQSVLDKFQYLKYSLAFILFFVAIKMLLSHHIEISVGFSMGLIAISLAAGILISIYLPKKELPASNI